MGNNVLSLLFLGSLIRACWHVGKIEMAALDIKVVLVVFFVCRINIVRVILMLLLRGKRYIGLSTVAER